MGGNQPAYNAAGPGNMMGGGAGAAGMVDNSGIGANGQNATANLFEIKKRSIDFF